MNEKWISVSQRNKTYQDHHPAIASDGNGNVCCAWSAYEGKNECIYVCIIKDDVKIDLINIYSTEHSCGEPRLVSCSPGVFDLVWLSGDQYETKVYYVRIKEGICSQPKVIQKSEFIMSIDLANDAFGKLFIVYSSITKNNRRVFCHIKDGEVLLGPFDVSQSNYDCMRPKVVNCGHDKMFVVWDEYTNDKGFTVKGCYYDKSDFKSILTIATGQDWKHSPSITADKSGNVYVAWLNVKDIINKDGVIDQLNTIQTARISKDGTIFAISDNQNDHIVALEWGLVPIDQVWGYLGRRRHPMVKMMPDGKLLLMWERKSKWDGGTKITSGTLCGRIWDGFNWSAEFCLQEGKRFYEPDVSGIKQNNMLYLMARESHEISHYDLVMSKIKICERILLNKHTEGWKSVNWKNQIEVTRNKIVCNDVEYTLFWGDLHVHSGLSADAEGEIDELVYYARDKAKLDVCAFQDNDYYNLALTEYEWRINQEFSKRYSLDGKFILLPGFEWTCVEPNGTQNHRSVILNDYHKPLIRYAEQYGDVMQKLDEYVKHYGAILHPHHAEWTLYDNTADVANVEVCSGWAQYINESENIHEHLLKGRVFGFIAGSDYHRRNPGVGGALTGIYAKELSLHSILEALLARRCFATDGNRTVINFWINDSFMGECIESNINPIIRIHVESKNMIKNVRLIRDGKVIQTFKCNGKNVDIEYIDSNIRSGKHFYYVTSESDASWCHLKSNIAPAAGPWCWSSPIWVNI